jgi:hypothetical protein
MAPSFSLFNHSFDSLGEAANYLGVDMPPLHSGIQSHSFGAGPTGSGDHENAAVSMLPPPIPECIIWECTDSRRFFFWWYANVWNEPGEFIW